MKIPIYLAMTAAEFSVCPSLPPHIAWMACHFSPYGTGLTNLPKDLPVNTLIILNDRTPISGHDCQLICHQLTELIRKFSPAGILLDFQSKQTDELNTLTQALVNALPCPVGVTEPYADGLDCPVFLPPVPPQMPLQEALAPWTGREIWLEAAPEATGITVTQAGTRYTPTLNIGQETGHFDDTLFCHYTTEAAEDAVRFALWRTREDLARFLDAASGLGVTCGIGLWQELG